MALPKPLFDQQVISSAHIQKVEHLRDSMQESPENFVSNLVRTTWITGSIVFLLTLAVPSLLMLLSLTGKIHNAWTLLAGIWYYRAYLALRPERNNLWPAIELDRAHAPKIFDILDELSYKMDSEKISRVRIGSEIQAMVSSEYQNNVLYIGLPLLRWLTMDEFRFIAAHEIAHLGRGRARIIRNALKVDAALDRSIESFSIPIFKQTVAQALRLFATMLLPMVQAASLDEELRVDQIAAKHTDPMAGSINLLRLSAINTALRAWPQQYMRDKIAGLATTSNAYLHFEQFCEKGIEKSLAKAVIQADLTLPTPEFSYHPAILERVRNLRCEPPLRSPKEFESLVDYLIELPKIDATKELFGDYLPVLVKSIHTIYLESYGDSWKNREHWLKEIGTATSFAIEKCHHNPSSLSNLGGAIGFYYFQRGEFEIARQWNEATLAQNSQNQCAQVGQISMRLSDSVGYQPQILDDFEKLGTIAKVRLMPSMQEYITLHNDAKLLKRFSAIKSATESGMRELLNKTAGKPDLGSIKAKPLDALTSKMLEISVKKLSRPVRVFSLEVTSESQDSCGEHVLILVGKPKPNFELAEKFDAKMFASLDNFIIPGSSLMMTYTFNHLRYLSLLAKIPDAEVTF